MLDLKKIVDEKMKTMEEDGTLEKAIGEAFENMLIKEVDNAFNYNSPVKKAIEECLGKGLKLNTSTIDLSTYNAQMLAAIKGKLGNLFVDRAGDHFLKEIEKTLEPPKKEMTTAEFVNKIVSMWAEAYYPCDDYEEFATVEIEDHANSSKSRVGNGWSIRMWNTEKKYVSPSPAVHVYVVSTGTLALNHNHSYNPTCLSEIDAFIFKAYAAGTVLTDIADYDEDDFELRIFGEDY